MNPVLISFAEAQELVLSQARTFGVEEVDLADVDGRILAEDLYADRPYPPFNRAMMDGYALMIRDWQRGIRTYKVLETVFAGQPPTATLRAGTCYKIMTGAAVPHPADVIIRREDAQELNEHATLRAESIRPFLNIAPMGEDASAGALIINAPVLCSPAVVSLLATIGRPRVRVMRAPKVALITTGNEVVDPCEPVSEFQIRNSNLFLLRSLLKKWKITPEYCQHVNDDSENLKNVLKEGLDKDIIIINGAVSAGDADHVPQTLIGLGVTKLFHKVNIRPGKPIWCGRTESGGIVFALPGNPLSCLTTFTAFIQPFLHRCFGLRTPLTMTFELSQARTKKSSMTEFFPVTIEGAQVHTVHFNSSGDVTAAIQAHALAVHPAETSTLPTGDPVRIYPFDISH